MKALYFAMLLLPLMTVDLVAPLIVGHPVSLVVFKLCYTIFMLALIGAKL